MAQFSRAKASPFNLSDPVTAAHVAAARAKDGKSEKPNVVRAPPPDEKFAPLDPFTVPSAEFITSSWKKSAWLRQMEKELVVVRLQCYVRSNIARGWPGNAARRRRREEETRYRRTRDAFEEITMDARNCASPEEVRHFMETIHHKGALDDGGLETREDHVREALAAAEFPIGSLVVVHGLETHEAYNGRAGIVERPATGDARRYPTAAPESWRRATRALHGISTRQPPRRRDASPRKIRVVAAAAASPRCFGEIAARRTRSAQVRRALRGDGRARRDPLDAPRPRRHARRRGRRGPAAARARRRPVDAAVRARRGAVGARGGGGGVRERPARVERRPEFFPDGSRGAAAAGRIRGRSR